MHQIIQELQQLQHQTRQIAQECQSLQNRLQMVTGDVEQEENRRQSQQQFGQARSYGSSQYGGMNTAGSYGAQYQPTSQYQRASQYQPTSQYQQTSQYQPTSQYQQTSQFGTMAQQRGTSGYQSQSHASYTGGTHVQGSSYSAARAQSPQFQASTVPTASQYQSMSNRASASSVSPSSLQAVLQADSSFSSQSSNLRQSEQPSYRRSI